MRQLSRFGRDFPTLAWVKKKQASFQDAWCTKLLSLLAVPVIAAYLLLTSVKRRRQRKFVIYSCVFFKTYAIGQHHLPLGKFKFESMEYGLQT
jgi:hypothetical protein